MPEPSLRCNRSSFTRCTPDWSWDSGPLPDYDLWLVEAGRGTMGTPDGELPILPGHAYLLRRGASYRGRQDPEHLLAVGAIHFDHLDAAGKEVDPAEPLPVMIRLRDPELVRSLRRRLLAATPQQASTWFAALHQEVLESAAGQAATATERILDELCAAIRDEPGGSWRVAALAARCGWSRHHFARRFRARTGTSPRDFVVDARIRAARDLLAGSDLPVTRVAEELGYADVYFFSRQFKERTGETPTAWRNRARNPAF